MRRHVARCGKLIRTLRHQNDFRIAIGGRITISIGVSNLPHDANEMDKLVDCADSALYASKRSGRNRLTIV